MELASLGEGTSQLDRRSNERRRLPDKSRFCVEGSKHGKRAIRKEGERYDERNTVSTVKWDGDGAMVWGCFWGGGFRPLEMIDAGSVDQETYINILANRFHPWFTNVTLHQERDFIFQEDGASCHTGGRKPIKLGVLSTRPAQSPDLNLIEHQLKVALQEEWAKLDDKFADRLVRSMKRRCEVVIKTQILHTIALSSSIEKACKRLSQMKENTRRKKSTGTSYKVNIKTNNGTMFGDVTINNNVSSTANAWEAWNQYLDSSISYDFCLKKYHVIECGYSIKCNLRVLEELLQFVNTDNHTITTPFKGCIEYTDVVINAMRTSNMEVIERAVSNSKEAEERALDALSQEFTKDFFKLWYF
ncbi:hypothetical protein G6F29_006028 [Rhizopus arrhizus]|nr:hypothetical protein G6F17_000345 [Rhizopus arrhizus]KAG0866928.1 hypothetical protein G6F16_009125 [Rhizopus arrhizus]KAG0879945.1 hypothetical protein G6F15_009028 [Rhizopus arrhizus]KAG0982787.1 hypothetical protein G6F29_006028 [Rhizopus arrhizus]KAG0991070.1 hypothetical protein G6F28_008932 [Rhizopus arrhizus]